MIPPLQWHWKLARCQGLDNPDQGQESAFSPRIVHIDTQGLLSDQSPDVRSS